VGVPRAVLPVVPVVRVAVPRAVLPVVLLVEPPLYEVVPLVPVLSALPPQALRIKLPARQTPSPDHSKRCFRTRCFMREILLLPVGAV
jgi:hypothetical protein